MAVIIPINDKKIKVAEVKNIGFTKKLKDLLGSDTLEGYEAFIEEAVNDTRKAVPEGYTVEDISFKPFGEVNLIIEIIALKN